MNPWNGKPLLAVTAKRYQQGVVIDANINKRQRIRFLGKVEWLLITKNLLTAVGQGIEQFAWVYRHDSK